MRKMIEAYKNTTRKMGDHGERTIGILKTALGNIDKDTSADIYGKGEIINDFEDKLATMLGKEKAVFFPSGTMAQQIALRMWCGERDIRRVAYHPLCHLEIYEEDGLKELHHIETVLLGEEDRLLTLDDLKQVKQEISTLIIELPQRGIGGQCPTWDELVEILDYCKEQGIRTHLDGARLWEVSPYYGRDLSEICERFDSVYVSFYKGIGGVAGAILAGPEDFMEKSKVWKRRHGGDLISLYPYVVSADYYLDQRLDKMKDYYESAKELAGFYNSIEGVYTIPEVPVSNMFHVHFDYGIDRVEEVLTQVMIKLDIGISPYIVETDKGCRFETNTGDNYNDIPSKTIKGCFDSLREKLV